VASNLASVNNFAEVYRIESSAPTTSLDLGDLYFDTTSDTLKVYGASGWQNAGSSINGTSQRYHYDISGTPTSVTGADANGNTLTYDAGYVDVYVNGVRMSTADVTVTSGDTVTFAEALADGDEVDIVGYGTFSVASLNADNLDSGTVPSARVSGAYTGITSVGTLTSFASTGIDDNASSTAMTLDSSNNLLVGTTDSNLTDNTTGKGIVAQANGALVVAREANTPFYVNRTGTSDGTLVDFRKDGGTVGSIGTTGTLYIASNTASGAGGFRFGNDVSTTLILPSTNTGANKDGNVSLGYSNNRFKDLWLSGGVYLGGTGSANYLDDYEEGTWTPVMSTNSGTAGSAGFSQTVYTKIGRMVYINCVIANIDTTGTTSTSQLRITGLPFTIDTAETQFGVIYDSINLEGSRTQLNCFFDVAEFIIFKQSGTGAVDSILDHQHLTSGSSDILFSGFYYTNQ
jgi:predicted RecA/RadA family phage recombinase